jgi:hypothetical protein
MSALTSHDIFFKRLRYNKLNEFLKRAEKYNNTKSILSDHINPLLTDFYTRTMVDTDKYGQCSIYIYIYNNITKDQYGHITIHFGKSYNDNIRASVGRFHVINNRNQQRSTRKLKKENQTRHVIEVEQQNNTEQIHFILRNSPIIIKSESFRKAIENALTILELYLNKGENNKYYLGNILTNPTVKHECLHTVQNSLRKSKTPLRGTMKTNKH